TIDVPTTNSLLLSLGQLVDSLTGLERILTSPIPFSYSFHLWAITTIFCLLLPFQIWAQLHWLTIPGTVVTAFFFFGFLVAGEEIENPFGYDKNDLNLHHFTHNIIRNELRAITSTPPPDPSNWAFSRQNDLIFASHVDEQVDRIPPEEWVAKGYGKMQEALAEIQGKGITSPKD
ncbi:Voltage-dependent anion channel-forming protein YneE/VCCN1/2-like protein, partial [Pleurotus pulmonarius]